MGYSDVTEEGHKGLYNIPAKTDSYVQRAVNKGTFHLGDNVVYNKNKNSGTIVGINGRHLRIHRKDTELIDRTILDEVFKQSELTQVGHWDHLTMDTREELLKTQPDFIRGYIKKDWVYIPNNIQKIIQKIGADTGAGMSAANATNSQTPNHSTLVSNTSGRGYKEPNAKNEKTKPGNDSNQLSHTEEAGHTVPTAKFIPEYPSHIKPITKEDVEKFNA